MWKTIVQYSSKANSGFVDSQGRHSWEMGNVSGCRLVQAVLLKCWSSLRASGAVDNTWCCSFLQPEVWQQVSVGSSLLFFILQCLKFLGGGAFSLRRMALLVLRAPLRIVRLAKMQWSAVSARKYIFKAHQWVFQWYSFSCFVSSKALGNAQQFSCLHMLSSCCGAELISLQRETGVDN